jgi:hypothetical protein
MNQLQALAMNEGYRQKETVQRTRASAVSEALVGAVVSRCRQELLELLDRINPTIEELTGAVEREARKRTRGAASKAARCCVSCWWRQRKRLRASIRSGEVATFTWRYMACSRTPCT